MNAEITNTVLNTEEKKYYIAKSRLLAKPKHFLYRHYLKTLSLKHDKTDTLVVWALRIGIFGTFLGHGMNAILIKPGWIPLITGFGFSESFAIEVMPIIGLLDIIVALIIIIYPLKPVIVWAAFWAFMTALSRPISGEPMVEFVEKAANWVIPLTLLLILKRRQ